MKRLLIVTFLIIIQPVLIACDSGLSTRTITPTSNTELTVTGAVTKEATSEGLWVPPSYLPTEMVGIDLSQYENSWKVYTNHELGFSFEYPTIYDEIDYCKLQERQTDGNDLVIDVGSRIHVIVTPTDLAYPIDDYIRDFTTEMEYVTIIPTPIASQQGYYVTYRYGGLGRLDLVYIVDNDSIRATFEMTGPVFCDIWEVNMGEFSAFQKVIDSFAFLENP